MNRRGFLGALAYGAFVCIASQLPWARYGAVFRTIAVDPDGSGEGWCIPVGTYVYNAKRCCKNCTMVFAALRPGGDVDNGPGFCHGELTPINEAARQIMVETEASAARHSVTSFKIAS